MFNAGEIFQESFMSTAAVSSSSLYQQLQTYFQTRQSDLQQLGQDLKNGDLTDAQQEFSAIQTLGQGGPFANGDAFSRTERQQDFNAVGQALQSGSVANAQQAFEQLASTFQSGGSGSAGSGTSSTPISTPSSSSSGAGSEIIINLGNLTPGEQITIGVNSESNGTEQLTISEGNQQNQSQNPEITLNLNPNRNEEILITLFNSAAQSTTSQASTQSTLNTTA
jgi:hypothetical protein